MDAAGNRTSKTSSGPITYDWDPLNRMDTVTRTSGAAYGFQYRADGLRSAQVYNGSGTSQSRITTISGFMNGFLDQP